MYNQILLLFCFNSMNIFIPCLLGVFALQVVSHKPEWFIIRQGLISKHKIYCNHVMKETFPKFIVSETLKRFAL